MALADLVALKTHRPCGRLLIDDREIYGFRARVRFSYSAVVATCELTLKERPSWLDFGMRVELSLGYNGDYRPRFVGFVEDDGRKAWPHSKTITAAGYMRRAERKNPSRIVYQNESARTIIEDLLTRAGVPFVSIEGDDTVLGTLDDVVLERNATYLSLIQQIDGPFLSKTYDCMPDGTVRRLTLTQLPAAAPKWSYEYPGNVLSIDNPLSVKDVKNRVEVKGLDGVNAYRRADSPYVADGYDEVHEVSSDLIETADVAADVALLWMPTVNRLTRQITVKVAGNPLLDPGDTILLDAPALGIDDELLYLAELDDDYSEQGYYSQLTLVGGKGEAGYAIYPPRAAFTLQVTQERFDAGDGPQTYYTVFCDGSASSSPMGLPLTFAWSNSKTADTSTGMLYSFRLTEAQYEGATVTLNVSDGTETDEVTKEVSAGGTVQVRDLYVAMETDAASSPNGGIDWYTSSIDARATPTAAWASASVFGAGTGLYWTDDHLQTAPTLVHTFGANITAISTCPTDTGKLVVGLANGQTWRSTNAESKESATWALFGSRGAQINFVYWGHDNVVWECAGRNVYANGAVLPNMSLPSGYTATGVSLVAVYGDQHLSCGTDGSVAVVRRGDGVYCTFEEPYVPVRLGGFPPPNEYDVHYAADEQGRFYRMSGETVFRYVSTIGGGECYHLINGGGSGGPGLIMYASCENGLYKSYDSGGHWYLVRSGKCLQAGIGSEPWPTVTTTTVLSDSSKVKCRNLWNGSTNDPEPVDWKLLAFDDSAWPSAVDRTAYGGSAPSGANALWDDAENVPGGQAEAVLFRQRFTLTSGRISTATLQVSNEDFCDGLWINGVLVYSDPTGLLGTDASANPRTYPIPQGVLKAGTNILAAKERQFPSVVAGPEWIAWRIDVS